MSFNLKGRSYLKLLDFTQRELLYLLDLSRDLKRAKYAGSEQQRLKGKNICLIFEKTSTRTRCAFEVAAYDQGANVTYLDPSGSQIGHKESMKDTARVLGRMFDAIEFRGAGQKLVEELAEYSGVPVYNGLTDDWHPTQMLADMLTMVEHADKPRSQIAYAYCGDARSNMGHSLLIVGCMMGWTCASPRPRRPSPRPRSSPRRQEMAELYGGKMTITEDPKEAVKGVDFIHTDVWVSMGEPADVWKTRIKLLEALSGQHEADEGHGQPAGQVHALPARVPQRRDQGRQGHPGEVRHQRDGGDRRGVREPGQRRLRAGREPPAHDQGDPRRHARGADGDARRRRPRRQRPAHAGRGR